jgi:glycosyltransferase involved in cell wall biosynthesis
VRIAVVSSVFVPDLGYLEEGVARALTSMGHAVNVFTSNQYPVNYSSNNKPKLTFNQSIKLNTSDSAYKITRLNTLLKVRSNIICFGLRNSIVTFNPELVILIGISDFFPISLLNKSFCNNFEVCAFIGQNYDMAHWRKSNSSVKKLKSYIINKVVKSFIYRKAIRSISRIIFYTPDTEKIIKTLIPSHLLTILSNKTINVPLGFNSEDFYFETESRKLIRNQLDIETEQVVFITVTRVERSKRIIDIIQSLYIKNKHDVIYLIVGLIDNEYNKEIESVIRNHNLKKKVLCFPFVQNSDLRAYLSASDIGIWLQSSASIQQAMGTGLPIILPRKSTTDSLIVDGLNGYYIDNSLDETISIALTHYSFTLSKRNDIAEYNKDKFSYQSILSNLIRNINS